MPIVNQLLTPMFRGTTGTAITVNAPTAVWTGGTPLTFDIDFATAGYAFINWDDTLEAWWRFENEASLIRDWSGHAAYLPQLGFLGTYTTGVFGGYGLYVNNGYPAWSSSGKFWLGFSNNPMITIAFWVRMANDADQNYLLSLTGASELKVYKHGGDQIYVGIIDGRTRASQYAVSTGTLPMDGTNYHHVAITINGATRAMNTYFDGVLDAPATAFNTPSIGPLVFNNCAIGSTAAGGVPCTGSIDEVLIFSRVLSAAEIAVLYDVAALGTLAAEFAVVEDSTHTYEVVHVSDTGVVTVAEKTKVLVNAS